jgi:hypothetical protein
MLSHEQFKELKELLSNVPILVVMKLPPPEEPKKKRTTPRRPYYRTLGKSYRVTATIKKPQTV